MEKHSSDIGRLQHKEILHSELQILTHPHKTLTNWKVFTTHTRMENTIDFVCLCGFMLELGPRDQREICLTTEIFFSGAVVILRCALLWLSEQCVLWCDWAEISLDRYLIQKILRSRTTNRMLAINGKCFLRSFKKDATTYNPLKSKLLQ